MSDRMFADDLEFADGTQSFTLFQAGTDNRLRVRTSLVSSFSRREVSDSGGRLQQSDLRIRYGKRGSDRFDPTPGCLVLLEDSDEYHVVHEVNVLRRRGMWQLAAATYRIDNPIDFMVLRSDYVRDEDLSQKREHAIVAQLKASVNNARIERNLQDNRRERTIHVNIMCQFSQILPGDRFKSQNAEYDVVRVTELPQNWKMLECENG